MTKISALTEATVINTTDEFVIVQSGVTKRVDASVINTDIAKSGEYFQEVLTSKYAAQPSAVDKITMTDTSDFYVGRAVKYTYGSVAYYGIVRTVSLDQFIEIAGATLDTSVIITKLEYGHRDAVIQMPFFVGGTFGDGTDTSLLANDMNAYVRWKGPESCLVQFEAAQKTIDTGSVQPKVNVFIDGSVVGTENTNAGPELINSAGTWKESSPVAISLANYTISFNESIEVGVTVGTNQTSEDLSGNLVFVIKA